MSIGSAVCPKVVVGLLIAVGDVEHCCAYRFICSRCLPAAPSVF
jgi:hypothetical protein